MNVDPRSPATRTLPLQFSLRTLLLLVFVCGVGMWYWRRPFVVKERLNRTYFDHIHHQGADFPGYEIRTYRRGWAGQHVQHGVTTILNFDEVKIGEETWVEGVKDGVFRRFDNSGYLYETGNYRAGLAHGRWITSPNSSSIRICTLFTMNRSIPTVEKSRSNT